MSEQLPVGVSIEAVLNSIVDGEKAHQARVPVYDRAYEVYRAKAPGATVQASSPAQRRQWRGANVRVPYGMQTIDTALVNIVGDPPRAKVKPRRPQDTDSAPKMQVLLDYHVAEDHLVEKWPLFVWQGLVYPLTMAKVHWLYRETETVSRDFIPNPSDPTRPIPVERSERLVLRDGPTFEPWDIYDAWWEPMARDIDTAAYVVLRSWPSKDDLLAQARSETNPLGLYDPAALQVMLKDGPRTAGRTLSALERMKQGTADKRKGRYELLEIWRDDAVIVVGERKVILRVSPNPYWHGRKPVVAAQTRIDGFEMTGIGETELLDDLQQALWTVHNLRLENLQLTVQRGFTYREAGVLDPRSLVVKPRFLWGVTDHDDIQPVDMPGLPAEAYKEDDVLLGRMQLVTGINPYVSGAQQVGTDQNTATGVSALTEIASRLLRFKARMLTYKGLQRTFELWGDLIQQFMDHETAVRIEGPDGIDWQNVSPQEIVGNYDYGVEGTEESLSRQQERGEAVALLNAFAPFAQLNVINWQPLLEKVATAYNFPSPTVLFRPQLQPGMGMPPAAPVGNGGPQSTPPPGPSTLDLSALHPAIVDAIQRGGR